MIVQSKSLEEWFGYGAEAMRSRIIAMLVQHGQIALAQEARAITVPRPSKGQIIEADPPIGG